MKGKKHKNFFKRGISLTLFFSVMFLFIPESQAVIYVYDGLNRLSGAIYEDGKYLVYEYDVNGNLVSTKLTEIDERLRNVISALKVLTGMNETNPSLTSLDINGDSKVGLDDVIHLLQLISDDENQD